MGIANIWENLVKCTAERRFVQYFTKIVTILDKYFLLLDVSNKFHIKFLFCVILFQNSIIYESKQNESKYKLNRKLNV